MCLNNSTSITTVIAYAKRPETVAYCEIFRAENGISKQA